MGESLLIRKGGGGGGLEITETLENVKVQPGKTVQAGEFVNIADFKYTHFPTVVDNVNDFGRSFPLDKINSNKVMMLFRDSFNSNRLTAQIIDFTGGTLTKGNKFEVHTATGSNLGDHDIKVLTSTTALVLYTDNNGGSRRLLTKVLNFTDNTINSAGSQVQLLTNNVNLYARVRLNYFTSTAAAAFFFDRINTNNAFKITGMTISGDVVTVRNTYTGLNGNINGDQPIETTRVDNNRITFSFIDNNYSLQSGSCSFSGTTLSVGSVYASETNTEAEVQVNYLPFYNVVLFQWSRFASSPLSSGQNKPRSWFGDGRTRDLSSNNFTGPSFNLSTYWFEQADKRTQNNSSWLYRRSSTNNALVVANILPQNVGLFKYNIGAGASNRESLFFATWNTTNNGYFDFMGKPFNYQRRLSSKYSTSVELELGKIASISVDEFNYEIDLFIFEDFGTKYCEPAFTTPDGLTSSAGNAGETVGVFVNT